MGSDGNDGDREIVVVAVVVMVVVIAPGSVIAPAPSLGAPSVVLAIVGVFNIVLVVATAA